uniref:Scaffolding protein n=1 Tax=viral metagenome TaxID=1070528 RepID=A0A6M3Y776_9ZZZZ
MDELDLDLDSLDQNIERTNKVEERIRNLSKARTDAQNEAEKLRIANEELALEKEQLAKERDFLNSFSDESAKYPNAFEYKDAIKEKVLAGYTVEDATLATLAKEGKLPAPVVEEAPAVKLDNPAGGSAATVQTNLSEKSVSEMTQEERREQLLEMEKKGELGTT